MKLQIELNGKKYDVNVTNISGPQPTVSYGGAFAKDEPEAPAAPAAAAPPPAAAPAAAAPSGPVEGTSINAPMPGTILDVHVTAGQAVKSGDTLMILEAMKMENEILAPSDGTVKAVSVAKGANVQTGDLLVVIG